MKLEIGKEWINIHKKISSKDVVQTFELFAFSVLSFYLCGIKVNWYNPESENRLKIK